MIDGYTIGRNLRKVFARATPQDIADGLAWYGRANGIAYAMGAKYGIRPDDAAAVIAILSPSNKWARNLQDAENVISHVTDGTPLHSVCTYGRNLMKAIAYLEGDHSQLSGPKVEAFAANIRGDHEHVTLDIWACRAAIGADSPGRHRAAIEAAYRREAAKAGYTPAAYQAVIWSVIRGSSN